MENKRLPKVRRLVNLVRPAGTGLIVAPVTLGSFVRAMTKTVRSAILARMENTSTQLEMRLVYPAYPGNINVSREKKNVLIVKLAPFQTTQN
jgi:hypothetical protein